MLPDRVSNPGPLTYESGVLPIALRGPAICVEVFNHQGKSSRTDFYFTETHKKQQSNMNMLESD